MRIELNENWTFTKEFSEILHQEDVGHMALDPVRLPHTCVETPYNCFDEQMYQMVMGYRRLLYIPDSWQGQHIQISFEGAAHVAEVFLNGKLVGTHLGGYTAFTCNITEAVAFGCENILVVKVDSRESQNLPPFGHVIDYMTYGGLYREAYLEVLPKQHIDTVFVHTALGNDTSATLNLEIALNAFFKPMTVHVELASVQDDKTVALGPIAINSQETTHIFQVASVQLWSLDTPNLYYLRLKEESGELLKEIRFGFRRIEVVRDGIFLNGERIKIRGLNRHQSYPYVGYAMPKSAQALDADILKWELGVNSVRTSHYPQSHHFVDRCDELGLLVFMEIPGWQHIGDSEWQSIAVNQVSEMVVQYRNHPSIFLWGVRINESQDNTEFYTATNKKAHELDPTRVTGGVRYTRKSELLEDVYTFNDFYHSGDNAGIQPKKKVTSNRNAPYLVTEFNGHMYPTKSFDDEGHRLEHALRHARVLDALYESNEVLGGYGWCMFDYNTHKDFGSGDRICYHGVMDPFRNPKLAASVYASQQKEKPVLEISSTMNVGEYPGSFRGDVYAFTNADQLNVYKNDVLIQSFDGKNTPFGHLPQGPILINDFIGDVLQVQEGFSKAKASDLKKILTAVSKFGPDRLPLGIKLLAAKVMVFYKMTFDDIAGLYTRYIGDWGQEATTYRFEALQNGGVFAQVIKGASSNVYLKVTVDRNDLIDAVTYDVATLRIRAEDEHGNLLSYYQEPIKMTLSGPITRIGPDLLVLRGGQTGTYIKTTGQSGKAEVILRSPTGQKVRIPFSVTHVPQVDPTSSQ